MSKEDRRGLFRKHVATINEEKTKKAAENLRVSQELVREQNRLISEFENHTKKVLQRAERHFLQREPVASILEIFDEIAQTIKEKEGKKIEITKSVDFFIGLIGRIGEKQGLAPSDMARLTHFLHGEPVANVMGTQVFDKKSSDDLVEGVEVTFKGPNGIRFGVSMNNKNDDYERTSNKLFWNIGNSSGSIDNLENIDLESLSYLLATKVSEGEYKHTPPQDWHMN